MTEDVRGRKPEHLPPISPTSPTSASGAGSAPRARGAPGPRWRGPSSGGAEDDWLLVGEVVGSFGLRGELKVRAETDFPERFGRTRTLYLGPDHTPTPVAGARLAGGRVLLRLGGIEDATAAAKLRGTRLYIPASEAAALAPNQFYLHDVIGLRAERRDGTILGTVTDVYTGTAQDTFVVRAEDSGREVLVPAVKEMIERVDVAAGVVVMEPIPGLFDEEFDTAE
jgi:16S rRNA processing protein RimM